MASACLPSIKRTVDVAENHFAPLIRQCYSESTFPCISRDFLSCSTTSGTWKEDTKSERSVDTHTDKDWEGTGERAQACSFWRSRTTKIATVASRKLLPAAIILHWDQPTVFSSFFSYLESLFAGLKNCVQSFNLHLADLVFRPVQWALFWAYVRAEEYGSIYLGWGRKGTEAGAM